ncbi:hypothetical protein G6O69_23870 [Pseudenhygromyxa sp. WMMC2535]|uniref:hypothetical protein n=1 Tax=Pseudenhygromyxa sp. WMMC2535 TaxID=2712867 RepID=UPI001557BB60|nr:hypothetical protein [Pseudenhygromyxa sp. WMMC2535]NVB40898.1 hypothetical protein [Pseudenhygromyxa sp. WMMC2535]
MPDLAQPFHRTRGRARALAMLLAVGVAAPVLPMTACKSQPSIPGTEIPDTDDNRQIIGVLERYRTSFVSRDAAAVLATAHPTYYDEGGTDDPSDDTTYADLGPLLRRRMSQLDSIRFTIDYLEIHVTGDRAIARVWVDASFRFKPLLDSYGEPRDQPPYARVQDHSEFELVREGDNWLIVRGI